MNELHIKSPSEHKVMGTEFPAELQIRGISDSGKKISLCYLVEEGAES